MYQFLPHACLLSKKNSAVTSHSASVTAFTCCYRIPATRLLAHCFYKQPHSPSTTFRIPAIHSLTWTPIRGRAPERHNNPQELAAYSRIFKEDCNFFGMAMDKTWLILIPILFLSIAAQARGRDFPKSREGKKISQSLAFLGERERERERES